MYSTIRFPQQVINSILLHNYDKHKYFGGLEIPETLGIIEGSQRTYEGTLFYYIYACVGTVVEDMTCYIMACSKSMSCLRLSIMCVDPNLCWYHKVNKG